jgi:ubiquitin thioesterase OTU1
VPAGPPSRTTDRHQSWARAGYGERALLIYDGLHYDALAVAAFEGAPEELDVTMFPPGGAEGEAIMAAAEKLVRPQRG